MPATGPNAQKVITHDAVKIHRDRFSLQVQLSGYISELKDTFNPEKGKIRYMIVCMCTIYIYMRTFTYRKLLPYVTKIEIQINRQYLADGYSLIPAFSAHPCCKLLWLSLCKQLLGRCGRSSLSCTVGASAGSRTRWGAHMRDLPPLQSMQRGV